MLKIFKKLMTNLMSKKVIDVLVNDQVYDQLMTGDRRLRGSLGMEEHGLIDFHPHKVSQRRREKIQLPHGAITLPADGQTDNITITCTLPLAEVGGDPVVAYWAHSHAVVNELMKQSNVERNNSLNYV